MLAASAAPRRLRAGGESERGGGGGRDAGERAGQGLSGAAEDTGSRSRPAVRAGEAARGEEPFAGAVAAAPLAALRGYGGTAAFGPWDPNRGAAPFLCQEGAWRGAPLLSASPSEAPGANAALRGGGPPSGLTVVSGPPGGPEGPGTAPAAGQRCPRPPGTQTRVRAPLLLGRGAPTLATAVEPGWSGGSSCREPPPSLAGAAGTWVGPAGHGRRCAGCAVRLLSRGSLHPVVPLAGVPRHVDKAAQKLCLGRPCCVPGFFFFFF